MAGFLIYGKDLRPEHYKGADGKPHYEILSVEGDFYTISNSTWDGLTELCSVHGVPIAYWPVFETCIDVPIEEVRIKNQMLKQPVLALPDGVVQSSHWLGKIFDRIKQGDIVVYCRM